MQPEREFTISFRASVSDTTGRPLLHLHVETVREFSSFGYVITLTDRSTAHLGKFVVDVGGIGLPTNSKPTAGPAVGELTWPMPPDGEYELILHRRKDVSTTPFTIQNAVPELRS
ncbi:hypothetical protein BH10BAC6_BH10BAC6_07940 [soil metagenome]